MGKLRDKSNEVLAQGIDERGYWNPSGAPLNVYNWFYAQEEAATFKDRPERENFCHFWRVVVIWAPLMVLVNAIAWCFGSKVKGTVTLIVLAAIILAMGPLLTWWIPGIIFGAIAVAAACALVAHLFDKIEFSFSEKAKDRLESIVFGLIVTFAVGAIAGLIISFGVSEGWLTVLLFALGSLGVVIVGVAIVGGISIAFDYFRTKRQVARSNRIREAIREGIPLEVAEDTKAKRFWRGVGDFLVLIAQIVKVNKWKICPIVTIDNPTVKE